MYKASLPNSEFLPKNELKNHSLTCLLPFIYTEFIFEFIFTGTVHINQRLSKSAGFSQPAHFQPQSLGRLLKTITIQTINEQ